MLNKKAVNINLKHFTSNVISFGIESSIGAKIGGGGSRRLKPPIIFSSPPELSYNFLVHDKF